MAKYYAGIAAGDTLNGMLANGGDYGVTPSLDIDCEDISCNDISCDDIGCRKVTATGEVKCNTTTAPFYPPVVTETQRDAMTVTAGAMVYNSTTNKLNYYNGTTWLDPGP